jgi:phosphatidylglycerol:prolipoprotein diacylglycerol transferase
VYPELLTLNLPFLGQLTITSFGVMMVAAFLLANWVMRVRLQELGEAPHLAGDVMVAALIGGLVGAKLYYIFLHWDVTVASPGQMIFSRAGLVWYGGLAGGALAVILLAMRRGLRVSLMAELTAPALALGYGVGRIGCFLVGDDYGRPTDSWIGMAFPDGSPPTTAGSLRRFGVELPADMPAEQVLSVYPTQLFEVAAALLIFWLLWRWRDHDHREGWLFAVWLVAAGLERLFIEFFRVKDDRILGAFTLAQAISVALLVAGAVLWATLRRRRTAPREG